VGKCAVKRVLENQEQYGRIILGCTLETYCGWNWLRLCPKTFIILAVLVNILVPLLMINTLGG